MKKMKNIIVALVFMIALSSCHFKNEQVDLIIHNAVIYTMDEASSVHDAMAIKDGVIIAIGAEREILNQYDAPQIIDARQHAVYPGFIDGHCHFLAYGLMLHDANLLGASSFDEMVKRVVDYAPTRMSEWIIGRGWDQNDWTAQEEMATFPDRAKLDSLFPNTPVYLTRIDGHAALVNGKALELAGITPQTKVEGGMVEVINGRCTGILIDKASTLVEAVMPARSEEEKRKALLAAQQACFEYGITTVDEAGLLHSEVELIRKMQQSQELKMRVYAMLSDTPDNFDYYIKHGIDTSSKKLTVRSFKFYADGALGSRGACLLSPYEDLLNESGRREYGMMLSSESHFREKAAILNGFGFQMNTHAIGDSANRVMLHIYRDVLRGTNDKRWRIEHAQVVHQEDVALFSQYNIIPSVQTTHATSDMPWAWLRLGKTRVARAYIYKELLGQNGLVALGTDFPVEGISPFATFYSAVVRKDKTGQPEGGFQMENALTREEALRGMTIWNAVANFEEGFKGSLEVGKVADVVILSQDIMKCDERHLLEVGVDYTVLGGEVVYVKP